jgi:hypothetical protein
VEPRNGNLRVAVDKEPLRKGMVTALGMALKYSISGSNHRGMALGTTLGVTLERPMQHGAGAR